MSAKIIIIIFVKRREEEKKKIKEDRWVKEIKVIACYFNLFGKGQKKGLYISY
ncbi:MAG: hypothetical protein ACI8RD_003484 [Bacillariaceae sp.]|jgi:hypothetical protein